MNVYSSAAFSFALAIATLTTFSADRIEQMPRTRFSETTDRIYLPESVNKDSPDERKRKIDPVDSCIARAEVAKILTEATEDTIIEEVSINVLWNTIRLEMYINGRRFCDDPARQLGRKAIKG
jgi:hypothetical protein